MYLVVTVGAVGCASPTYRPRGPGVSKSFESNKPVYIRDGRSYERGFFGEGLQEAVRGDPRAYSAATKFSSRLKRATVGLSLGTVGLLGGTTYWIVRAIDANASVGDHWFTTRDGLVMASTLIASLAFYTWGAIEMVGAQTAEWDAINIFNDAQLSRCADPTLRNCPIVPRAGPAGRSAPLESITGER